MAIQPDRRRFTVDEYHRMGEAGILGEDDRLELIEGVVTEMTPIGRRHSACVTRLSTYFFEKIGRNAVVWAQNPVDLPEHSEPQPDLVLLRPRSDFYEARHPIPEDVILLVEIAETSVDYDRKVKAPLYARNGIRELWLVDLAQETITVYQDPAAGGYRAVRVLRRGDDVAPSAFPDRVFTVAGILG